MKKILLIAFAIGALQAAAQSSGRSYYDDQPGMMLLRIGVGGACGLGEKAEGTESASRWAPAATLAIGSYLDERNGVALDVSAGRWQYSASGLTETTNIVYAGPFYTYRLMGRSGWGVSLDAGLGALLYFDKTTGQADNMLGGGSYTVDMKLFGGNVGYKLGIGVERLFGQVHTVGLHASLTSGSIGRVKINGAREWIETETLVGDRVSLSHVNVMLYFCFGSR